MKYLLIKILLSLTLASLSPSGLLAQPLQKAVLKQLKFYGARHYSDARLKQWLALSTGVSITEQSLKEHCLLLLENLKYQGHYFARIDSIDVVHSADSSEVEIGIYINENEVVRVANYDLEGLPSNLSEIRDKFRLQENKPFDPKLVDHDTELLIRELEQLGFPFADVSVTEMTLATGQDGSTPELNLSLSVVPGPQVMIAEIAIIGNEQTKDRTILRELPFAEGTIYRQNEIDRIQSKLMNLGYFSWVNPPRLQLLKENSARLIIELNEGNHNRFDGILGYNPATESNSGFVTGLLDFKFGNLFGTGRQLAAKWERRSRETQALRLYYTEPWIAGIPLAASLRFQQLIQDTSYIEREVGLEVGYRLGENLSVTASLSRREISPHSLASLRFGILPRSSVNLAAGFSFGSLDNPFNPTRGLLYSTSFVLAKKKTENFLSDSTTAMRGSVDQKHLLIDFESYFPLFRWQVLAFALHGRQVKSDERLIPIPDLYQFGGTQSLRGYREQQFRGERIVWTNLEYRYLTGPRSRFFTFLDVGYFLRRELSPDEKIVSSENFKFGFGFGARIDTRLGLFGLDYGLGEGDSFSNGKVHISLTNEF